MMMNVIHSQFDQLHYVKINNRAVERAAMAYIRSSSWAHRYARTDQTLATGVAAISGK